MVRNLLFLRYMQIHIRKYTLVAKLEGIDMYKLRRNMAQKKHMAIFSFFSSKGCAYGFMGHGTNKEVQSNWHIIIDRNFSTIATLDPFPKLQLALQIDLKVKVFTTACIIGRWLSSSLGQQIPTLTSFCILTQSRGSRYGERLMASCHHKSTSHSH